MKQKFIALTKPLLCACMALSCWISCSLPSIVFFGEYEYPANPDEQ